MRPSFRPQQVRVLLPTGMLLLLVVLAPTLWGATADEVEVRSANAGVSWAHWLGTDQLGRDVLARVVAASRMSLLLAVSATAISVVLGTLLGVGLALARRRVRMVGLRVVDALMAFPAILLAIMLAAVLEPGASTAVLAIGVAGTPGIARLTSNVASAQLRMEYVQNARVVGVGDGRLFRRYLLPPVLRSLGITATYDIGLSLVSLASLSFLGLGVQLPSYDWGRLLADGIKQLNLNVWAAVAPSVAIIVAGAFCAILGEALSRHGSRSIRRQRVGRRPVPAGAGASGAEHPDAVIQVDGLTITYPQPGEEDSQPVVQEVDLTVSPGEIVGIIGESGSGKSTLAGAMSDLLPASAKREAKTLRVAGADLLGHRADIDRQLRSGLAVVFQDPMSSLNPGMSIRRQMAESVGSRGGRAQTDQRAVYALSQVRITMPQLRLRQRPFELSGGMRQRAMIAMGLAVRPRVLIADEPTTALDVTVQQEILSILSRIREEHGTAIVLISHDLNLVGEICDTVCVMQHGRIVERGATAQVLARPHHPYTQELLDASITLDTEVPQRADTVGLGQETS